MSTTCPAPASSSYRWECQGRECKIHCFLHHSLGAVYEVSRGSQHTQVEESLVRRQEACFLNSRKWMTGGVRGKVAWAPILPFTWTKLTACTRPTLFSAQHTYVPPSSLATAARCSVLPPSCSDTPSVVEEEMSMTVSPGIGASIPGYSAEACLSRRCWAGIQKPMGGSLLHGWQTDWIGSFVEATRHRGCGQRICLFYNFQVTVKGLLTSKARQRIAGL